VIAIHGTSFSPELFSRAFLLFAKFSPSPFPPSPGPVIVYIGRIKGEGAEGAKKDKEKKKRKGKGEGSPRHVALILCLLCQERLFRPL